MIGVFDSGVGGLCAYERLKELLPNEELIYLKDTENAPYGTKTRSEVLSLTKKNVRTLRERGAAHILIACCTASGLWSELTDEEKSISTPIIFPAAAEAVRAAREAKAKNDKSRPISRSQDPKSTTKNRADTEAQTASPTIKRPNNSSVSPSLSGKGIDKEIGSDGGLVAVISTELTAKNHTFKKAIEELDPAVSVCEMGAQMLVSLVELGARDGILFPRESALLDSICKDIKASGASALILGCTHFSHLKEEFKARLGEIKIIDTARLGAEWLAKKCKQEFTKLGQK